MLFLIKTCKGVSIKMYYHTSRKISVVGTSFKDTIINIGKYVTLIVLITIQKPIRQYQFTAKICGVQPDSIFFDKKRFLKNKTKRITFYAERVMFLKK